MRWCQLCAMIFSEEMPRVFDRSCGGPFPFYRFPNRQLSMRQGAGKIKHLSGKILWIQHVGDGR